MANMFDIPNTEKKACPIISAGIGAALMNHAIDEEYKSIVLENAESVIRLGFCIGSGCAWWDDFHECCGVISK